LTALSGDIGHCASGFHVEADNLGENRIVSIQVGAENEIVRWMAVSDHALVFRGGNHLT
jgi:hypothetical protein